MLENVWRDELQKQRQDRPRVRVLGPVRRSFARIALSGLKPNYQLLGRVAPRIRAGDV